MRTRSGSKQLRDFVVELYSRGVIAFESVAYGSGIEPLPVHFDLRLLPSYPGLFAYAVRKMMELVREEGIRFDRIAGIAESGLTFATAMGYSLRRPVIWIRRERKTYGRKNRVEGVSNEGDRYLIVDDLVETGKTIEMAATVLEKRNSSYTQAIVFVDKERGGKNRLSRIDVPLHSILGLRESLVYLQQSNVLRPEDEKTMGDVLQLMTKRPRQAE